MPEKTQCKECGNEGKITVPLENKFPPFTFVIYDCPLCTITIERKK